MGILGKEGIGVAWDLWNFIDSISDSYAKEFKPKVPNEAKCNNWL